MPNLCPAWYTLLMVLNGASKRGVGKTDGDDTIGTKNNFLLLLGHLVVW